MENLPRHRVKSVVLFAAASATLCITGNVFAQFETLAVPPLSGFQPLVVMGLTDEQADPNDFDAGARASSTPGANGAVGNDTLPIGQPQRFFVGVLDTGAQSSIIQDLAATQANLVGAGRDGTNVQEVVGASGTEFPTVTDALGLYATGFGNASVSSGSLNVTAGSLRGMWNTSVLQAESGSSLPNILGAPMVGLYQVSIKNSTPYHLSVDNQTYRSPQVDFAAPNTPVSSLYGKVALTVTQNVGNPPSYIPDFNEVIDPNWDGNLGNNPAGPTIWESMFLNVKVTHTGGNETDSFLFDTGAEVSVLSSTTAANVGIFTTGENPTPPDFFIEVVGVGGATEQVPGYYVNQLSLTSTSGQIIYNRAPVIVLDVPDPRNPNETLPGVLGTNLLTSRDLVINVGQGNSFLYVSPQWAWKGTAGGNWSDSTKWGLVLPNGIDTQANFFTPTGATSPQTITVDSPGFTVGSIAFDNANRYTLNGPGRITLDVSVDHAQINVNSGSHTINAPVTLMDDTDVNVAQSTSTLTITSDVDAGTFALAKQGAGVLEMKNVRAGALHVDGGVLKVLANGANAGASRITSLAFTTGAQLDLTNNTMAIDYTGPSPASDLRAFLQSGYASGTWTGAGVVSSHAAAIAADSLNQHKTAIGFAEASSIGSPSQWFGQNVDGAALLLRYVFAGDANLDGTVGSADFTKLAQNFGGTTDFWYQGDFNYDGVVNALDFGILASNFGQVMTSQALASVVPEPAFVCSIGLLLLMRRRRNARQCV